MLLTIDGRVAYADNPPPAPSTIAAVNIDPDNAGALGDAAKALSSSLTSEAPKDYDHAAKITFWEVSPDKAGHQAITTEAIKHWTTYVQQGGCLLVGFDQKNSNDVMRLEPFLPVIPWRVTRDPLGPSHLAEGDPKLFPDASAIQGMAVPYYYPLRPWLAVDRGQARYDVFEQTFDFREDDSQGAPLPPPAPQELTSLPIGREFWSRPLLNRDWAVRARAADAANSPLLLTGRYGAGRVAVFASSLATTAGPQAQAFWTQVIKWLGQDEAAPQPVAPPATPLAVSISGEADAQSLGGEQQNVIDGASGSGKLAPLEKPNTVSPGHVVVLINNPNAQPIHVKVVARFLSWEHALLGDGEVDATVPANAVTAQVKLPVPAPSAISYHEITVRPAYDVRVGVLSANGDTLLAETTGKIDLTPPVSLAVHTEELRTIPYPFPTAARPDKEMIARNGMPVYSYAYLPGATVQATVKVANGARNIASLATITDVSDPTNKSAASLNIGASGLRKPEYFLPSAYNSFQSATNEPATLKLAFPAPVTVTGITLWGAPDSFRWMNRSNPTDAVISQGDKVLAHEPKLADRFQAEDGQVWIPISPPVQLQELTVTLTKTGVPSPGINLAQIAVTGTADTAPPTAKGKLSLFLTDALTGKMTPVHSEDIKLGPLEEKQVPVPVTLPNSPDAQFYRLDSIFTGQDGANTATDSFPIFTVSGKEPVLQSMDTLQDEAFDSIYSRGASMGFIVTRGFRNVFDNAVGTAEMMAGWGQPDDLVWAYAHSFKENGGRTKTQASRLYVSQDDMRHYSTPWRTFLNGEDFYDVATPLIVNRMKELPGYDKSDLVVLGHSDRWDAGPLGGTNYSWQDFESFNAWLLSKNLPPLQGRTLPDLIAEVTATTRVNQWYSWQMEHYVSNIRNLRDSFTHEGKRLLLTAQGMPTMPLSAAPEIDSVVRGTSDDNTWGEAEQDLIFTTGRQMAANALNPTLGMATLNQWQWVSGVLQNFEWHAPMGTTEPAQRRQYDRAFRGALRPDGTYGSMSVYGYNTNGGIGYALNEVDYNQWEQTMIKQSLLFPTAPIGAGVIVSNAKYDKLENALLDCGDGSLFPEMHLVQNAVRRLSYAGLSVSFSGNAALLAGWKNNAALVLLNLQDFSDAEQAAISQMATAGRPLVVFQGQGTPPLSSAMAALFGVTTDGQPADGKTVAQVEGRSVVQKGNCLYVPAELGSMSQEETNSLAPILHPALNQVITFPQGTTGYGFVSNGRNFAVVEDWREEGRMAELRVKASPTASALQAVETNSNLPLQTTKDGNDWVIHLPIRPGDASLVAFKEILP